MRMEKNIMSDDYDNKHNLVYFESASMRDLYENMEDWQNSSKKRLLSASIHQDGGAFCCIALTNPTETVLVYYDSENGAWHKIPTGWNGELRVVIGQS